MHLFKHFSTFFTICRFLMCQCCVYFSIACVPTTSMYLPSNTSDRHTALYLPKYLYVPNTLSTCLARTQENTVGVSPSLVCMFSTADLEIKNVPIP